MDGLEIHIKAVEKARNDFIKEASGLKFLQSEFKPEPNIWSIKEIVEHIVWAEKAGVLGIWKAMRATKEGNSIWKGENVNENLTIEEVVERTWLPKEKVPEIAKPRWGGPIEFWLATLASYQHTLLLLGKELNGMNPETIIFPHPISGPLNVYQRMQFLCFHMQRHQKQIRNLKIHPNYPS